MVFFKGICVKLSKLYNTLVRVKFVKVSQTFLTNFHYFSTVCVLFFRLYWMLINLFLTEAINHAAEVWGISCLRYEISKLLFKLKCTLF